MSENLVTMVFTDLVSSTAIKLKLPGADITENNRIYRDTILLPHRQRVESTISAYGGRKVETIGDAFFLVFTNPVEAVQWSIAIQMNHIDNPIPTPLGALQITIGMHTGSPLADGNNFIGHEVDYAARVASLANAEQILVSEATEVLVRLSRSTGFVTYRHGDRNLKGIGTVPIFEVLYHNKQPKPLKESSKAQPITNIPQDISELKPEPKTQPTSPNLNIPADIQEKLETLLLDTIGPVAHPIVQNALERAKNLQDLLERLVISLPEKSQEPFLESAKKLLKIQGQDLSISTKNQPEPTAKPLTETTSAIAIELSFVQQCQVELAKSIGPLANFIVKQAISNNPKSPTELVETLAKHIPNPQEAQEFRRYLLPKK